MIKLTILLFVCSLISTGYLQEITNLPVNYFPPNVGNSIGSPILALQNHPEHTRRVKPCPRRSSRNSVEEQWVPSYSSKITHPLREAIVLQPQALKNEEFKLPYSAVKIENDLQSAPDRRSLDSIYFFNPSEVKDEDCDDHLVPTNTAALSTANTEKTAIKVIEDCLTTKQNANANEQRALGSSRRSMSEPDDSDFHSYNRDLDPIVSKILENDENKNYPLELDADISRDGDSQNNLEDKYANKLTTKLMDPEKGTGIAERRALDNLPKNARVCYACSTATNPSCWEPDKRTTVKYCTKEQSCVTKSFGVKNSLTMIRDCANTCEGSAVPGIEPKYKSCKLCHSDFCNGAFSINSFNLVFILVIISVKFTLSYYHNV